MKNPLKTIETPYIDAQTLLTIFSNYQKPRECILRLVKNEELIRLKNGFYLIADKIKFGTNTIIPYEQIANLLYGPSYISLEWALSFYGMIPERVHTVTSMTLGRNKRFETAIGEFTYASLPAKRYSVGITQKNAENFIGRFFIATPEKALADLVFVRCKDLKKDQLEKELIESKRMDRETLQQLNKNLLQEIADNYRNKNVNDLVDLMGGL